MTRFVLTIAVALLVSGPASAQDPVETRIPKTAPLHMISELAETLGRAHAVRTLCNGDQDGYWRNYMLTMMSYEASGGPRRAALTDAFNRGYRAQNRETPSCTDSSSAAEARIAARGKELADAIARTYMD